MTKRTKATKVPQSAYNQEFRETAVQLALAGNKSMAEVARELNLPEWKIYSWVEAWKKKNKKAVANEKGAPDEELRKLQKRNKELEQEVVILKKAAAYFAKTLL
jgi:transposase